MPYIPNIDNEDQPGSNTVSPGAGGTRLSPSGGVGSVPGAGAPSPTPGAGGSFATLQNYLTANQGQAAPLANKITSGIQNQYNTLQGQNASTISGIQNQVNQASTPEDTALLAQEAANPVSFASNPGNVSSFQKQLSDQYTGPTSAESTAGYQNQQAAINNAIATGTAQTGSEAGREQLLQQNEARPTTGVTALNSAILTQSPDYLSQVQNAYQPFSNLLTGLTTGANNIDTSIGQSQSQAQDVASKANAQIASQTQGLQTDVQTALTNAQNQANQYNQGLSQYQAAQSANQPLIADITGSGLLKQFNIANPFGQTYTPVAAPTQNAVATPNQLALQNALNTLAPAGNLNIINPNAPVGGFTVPANTPTAPNFQNILDQLALGEVPNYPGVPGLAGNPVLASRITELAAPPTGPGGALNYTTQVAPFQQLMTLLNQQYGNKYVSPLTFGLGQETPQPIPGAYQLNT